MLCGCKRSLPGSDAAAGAMTGDSILRRMTFHAWDQRQSWLDEEVESKGTGTTSRSTLDTLWM